MKEKNATRNATKKIDGVTYELCELSEDKPNTGSKYYVIPMNKVFDTLDEALSEYAEFRATGVQKLVDMIEARLETLGWEPQTVAGYDYFCDCCEYMEDSIDFGEDVSYYLVNRYIKEAWKIAETEEE